MPTASTIILGAISAGGSAMNIIQGSNAKGEAQQAAAKAAQSIAQMQEEDKFRNLQLPTLGLELAQQNLQARQATNIQALQEGGATTVLGGLTAANQQAQAQDLQLAAQAQEAQYARDMAQAQNAQAIEQRNMARQAGLEQQRLIGAQNAAAFGQQQMNAGIQGLAQTAGNVMAQSLGNKSLFNEQQAAKGLNPNGTLTGAQIQKNAQAAFASQIKSMMPSVPSNTGLSMAPPPTGIIAQQPINWNQQPAPYPWASLGLGF
jgi:hypothetical protein